jgi:S-adenosylmethionine decarboxylase
MIVGMHIIAELYGVPKELITYEDTVREIMEEVMREAQLTKVGSVYKQFNPHGVAGVALIAESHISIHTWPEYGFVNLDIFTCGDVSKTKKAFDLFIDKFKPKSYKHHIFNRGYKCSEE